MKILYFTSLFCVYTLGVASALSTFFKKGQRPEIFELTDDEVAVFKVTLPNEEFQLLKDKADVIGLTPPISNLTYELETMKVIARKMFEIFNFNFTELMPGVDVRKEFSGFYIGQDGYPNIDEIMNNLDFDVKNYADRDFVFDNVAIILFKEGKHDYVASLMKFMEIVSAMNNENDPALNSAKTIANAIIESTKNNGDTGVDQKNTLITNAINDKNLDQENPLEEVVLFIQQILNVENASATDDDFKTKNGTLSVKIAGKEKSFDKITFSLSGQYSRRLVKPNFNLKIRGKQELFGRSQFKLRSDLTEPTFLRSKLTSDIHKKMNLTGILANYATLYINEEYMGLFVLTDHLKSSWVEQVYGEKDTTHLYKCSMGAFLNEDSPNVCVNDNDDVVGTPETVSEWENFMKTINNAQSAEDIEDIFEVDHFIKEMAIEYLLGAWDHLQLGHNFFLYKQPNGKWIYMSYDHDHSFGINLDRIFIGIFYADLPERMEKINRDYPNYSFAEWTKPRHLIDILILKDPTRFNQALKEIVETIFNPAALFPRIDELKKFIRPYVEKEYTQDEEGYYPGRINNFATNPYTFKHWEANSEYTTVATLQYNAYGIKYWILAKYRNVCKTYDKIKCDSIYLDENYKYEVDKSIEFTGYDFSQFDISTYPDPQEIINIDVPNGTDVPISTSTIQSPTDIENHDYESDVEEDITLDPELDHESDVEDGKLDPEFDHESDVEDVELDPVLDSESESE